MCALHVCTHCSKKKFSFDFHMKVAKEVVEQMMKGGSKPEDLVHSKHRPAEAKATKERLSSDDGLSSDTRLWAEVMRNLGKDAYKNSSILVTGGALSTFSRDPGSTCGDVLAFSCGHVFTEAEFESKVLIDFKERVQNFPLPIPQTLLQLQRCYKKLNNYPLACPFCVFQYLRQHQLQECPDTPIRPWTQ